MTGMIGHRIAALRRDAGMSQAQLAKVLKVSPSAVGMYEQGRREPSVETLAAMAQLFSVSVDYLVTGQCQEPRDQERFSQVMARRLLTAEQRMEGRRDRPFSRQELAVLFAAMLMEP